VAFESQTNLDLDDESVTGLVPSFLRPVVEKPGRPQAPPPVVTSPPRSESKRIASLRVRRVGLVVCLALLDALIFFRLQPLFGAQTAAVYAVHIAAAAILFGWRGGVATAVLTAGVSTALLNLMGIHGWDAVINGGAAAGLLAGVGMGGVLGLTSDLGRRFKKELVRGQRAERQKQEFSALLVHDLKNPLTAIQGNAQFLAGSVSGDEADAVKDILAASRSMHRMVMNLLDISRSEDGALLARPKRVDVAEIVDDVVREVRMRAATSGQLVEAETTASARVAVVDPDLFQRMVENLIDNAIKYAGREGHIRVQLSRHDEAFELRIRDNGPGVPVALREKIFEKYARLDRDLGTAAANSRGLGLAFCRVAAQSHGGNVWVEDNEPQGSVFVASFPQPEARA
jgi:signal transduction histidine kinase